jgi:redox-sensitive bicupin YhaK (pirin superfamily)
MDVNLVAGAEFNFPITEEYTVLVYVFDGQGIFGDTEIASVKMAIFDKGNQFKVHTGELPVRFMLMAGAPSGEPIIPYGPFVMNTREEIQQALSDLRDGTFV